MPTYPRLNLLVSDIDPAVLAAQAEVNAAIATMAHPDPRTPEGLAALRAATANNPGVPELTPVDHHIDGPQGLLRLRVIAPKNPRGVLYRIHGGGWAAGAPEDDDVYNDRMARATGLAVISPDYGLVPDVTVIDQIHEVVAGARWVGEHAAAQFGTDTLFLGGISAGAHLAATTLLHLRDSGDPTYGKVVGAILDCGIYDLGGTPSMLLATNDTLVLTRDWLDGLNGLGLPGLDAHQRRQPRLSPALADLRDFPPTLFTVGQLDPLRDDSVLLATRLHLAGRDVELDVWPQAAHAFTNMATPLGDVALQRNADWLNRIYQGRTMFGVA